MFDERIYALIATLQIECIFSLVPAAVLILNKLSVYTFVCLSVETLLESFYINLIMTRIGLISLVISRFLFTTYIASSY